MGDEYRSHSEVTVSLFELIRHELVHIACDRILFFRAIEAQG